MYASIPEFIHNTIQEATKLGFSLTTPKTLHIIGSTILGDLETPFVDVTVSYSIPPDPSVMWLNAANRTLYQYAENGWVPLAAKYRADIFRGGSSSMLVANTANGSTQMPVQDSTALTSINTATLIDKTIIYVEDSKSLYAYDANSQEAGSDTVLVPDSGVGRWYLIAAPNLIGNADGGSF